MPNLIMRIYELYVRKHGTESGINNHRLKEWDQWIELAKLDEKERNKKLYELGPVYISKLKDQLEIDLFGLLYDVVQVRNPYMRMLALELFFKRRERVKLIGNGYEMFGRYKYTIFYPDVDSSDFFEFFSFKDECGRCNEKVKISTEVLKILIGHSTEKKNIKSYAIYNDLAEYNYKLRMDGGTFNDKIICFQELYKTEIYNQGTGKFLESLSKYLFYFNGKSDEWFKKNMPRKHKVELKLNLWD